MARMTRKEMAAFGSIVGPMLPWWAKVESRLQDRGEWETRDKVLAVRDAIHALSVHLHYETIDGAGKVNERRME